MATCTRPSLDVKSLIADKIFWEKLILSVLTTNTEDEPYVLDIESCIESQAWTTARNYNGFVDKDDLVQEAWLWVVEHPEQVEAYKNHEQPKLAYWWLQRDLWKVMDAVCRKERAQRLGYDPSDEAFYGKALLEALLPGVLNGAPVQPQGEVSEIRSGKDPAEGGTYLAMYLDVSRAWKEASLTPRERSILRAIYGEGFLKQEVAEDLGITPQAISNQLKRSFEKMIKVLGGQYPPDIPENSKRP